MLKELTCRQALLEYFDGEKITVAVESDLGALAMEEIVRLNKAGAKFLMEVEEEQSPPLTGTPKDKTKPARRQLDTGKMLALKKAGWKQAAIAEELGVSPATVSTTLKKLEEERNDDKN